MFSADNRDSELDNQNYSQNNSVDNQSPSHSNSKTDSLNQSEEVLCPECEESDNAETGTGEDKSIISSRDKEKLGESKKKECRHSSKERTIIHARRKDLETRQLSFPYSVINCKYTTHSGFKLNPGPVESRNALPL